MLIMSSSNDVSISVLIPTARKRLPKRGKLFHLIFPMICRLPISQVIVAGDPSDCFLDGAKKLSVPVSILHSQNVERNHLRNLALKQANGTHILTLDDDTILLPHRGFLKKIRELHEGDLLTFADRRHLPMNHDFDRFFQTAYKLSWAPRIRKWSYLAESTWRESEWYTAEISFPTNFCIVHRKTILDIGGFDELMKGWGYEDVDFANRILKNGSIFSCRKNATVVHIEHHISPNQGQEAYTNYRAFREKCETDPTLAKWSAMFYGVASRFLDRFEKYSPLNPKIISNSIKTIPHFAVNKNDLEMVTNLIMENSRSIDLVAVGVYGSAARTQNCRDVDLCLVAGQCENDNVVRKMPSGKVIELQFLSLLSIRRQLKQMYYLGDNAFLQFFKFRHLKFVYDYKRLASRYMRICLNSDRNILPYLISLYVGLSALYLEKKRTADQLVLGRYLTAVGMLTKREEPSREVAVNNDRATEWLYQQIAFIKNDYLRFRKKCNLKEFLLWPPNMIGDSILVNNYNIKSPKSLSGNIV